MNLEPHAEEVLLTRADTSKVLIIAAHPDDEVIGAASVIWSVPNLEILHVTDGSPHDLRDARAAGCRDREHYAALRRCELRRALETAGRTDIPLWELGIADQHCVLDLPSLVRRVTEQVSRVQPDIIITHPYEGGHPDHDATVFAVHGAVRFFPDPLRPQIVEMTSYHQGPAGIQTGVFLESSSAHIEEFRLELSAWEQELKQSMFRCFRTQQETLQYFSTKAESFRPAPEYVFTKPPHAGPVFYDQFSWGISSERWCELATAALGQMQGISPAVLSVWQ